ASEVMPEAQVMAQLVSEHVVEVARHIGRERQPRRKRLEVVALLERILEPRVGRAHLELALAGKLHGKARRARRALSLELALRLKLERVGFGVAPAVAKGAS